MAQLLDPEERTIVVPTPAGGLEGTLGVPRDAFGVVVFAHGSGSSRFSSRNRAVARSLRGARLATLLLDLLTPREESVDRTTGHLRFDVPLLAHRVQAALELLRANDDTARLPIGLFGASTGAAAALVAASGRDDVAAIVSRGGRPDLAGASLVDVRAPTLLIVGGDDVGVLDLNRGAYERLRCTKELVVVPGMGHLFEEPGGIEEVSRLSRAWFRTHLARRRERAAARLSLASR